MNILAAELWGPEGPVVIGGGRGPRVARHDDDLRIPTKRITFGYAGLGKSHKPQ